MHRRATPSKAMQALTGLIVLACALLAMVSPAMASAGPIGPSDMLSFDPGAMVHAGSTLENGLEIGGQTSGMTDHGDCCDDGTPCASACAARCASTGCASLAFAGAVLESTPAFARGEAPRMAGRARLDASGIEPLYRPPID